MDLFIYYDNNTGLELYLQFDDATPTRIPFIEGVGSKLRRYVISEQDVIDSGLVSGQWSPTVRVGDMDYPLDDDPIKAILPIKWSGLKEVTNQTGGGILNAQIGVVSLTDQDYLEIIQGERKIITFIVEAHGSFITDIFDIITIKIKDAAATVITKAEDDDYDPDAIMRVCQELDVQVLRCTLSEEDTLLLTEGLVHIEIAFDNQKARLTHSLKIIDRII